MKRYSISYKYDSNNLTKMLHDICNWNHLNKVAIEYHGLQQVIYISYQDVLTTRNIISDYLKCIKHFEFIGINFDIPEYCIVSLILGILTSEHGFLNVPSDVIEFTTLKNLLRVQYLFSKQITTDGSILHQFIIHNECIYLIKLKHVQEQTAKYSEKNHYAYAICTSGSTGISKVIKVPHSCIVPNILDLTKILTITESDKIAQFTNFTFDPSIVEIFLALSNAGTLFMVSKLLKNNPNRLIREAYSSQITVLQITPSVFLHSWTAECLKTTILSNDTSLKALVFGGEPFPKTELLLETKHPCNTTKIYNIYGITEVSCWASINEILVTNAEYDTRCLGQVLSQTMFRVKNEMGEVLTEGTGSLYIGSNTRVCTINEENIEELELPVFRDSGDVVNIDKESNIFYKGRRNSIIKRFGNKVDLVKLEELMLQLHFIKSCYVIWDESYHRLHVCLVLKEEIRNYFDINTAAMEHLQKLDSLYKPDKIHVFEHVEYTSSGKISMEFLKQRCLQDQTIDLIQDNIDSQKIENMFKSIWKNNLKHEDGGFVKLGGTSITALQMSSTMSKVFNVEFSELIGMLLRDATIDECLAYIKITMLNSHKNTITVNTTCYSHDNEMIPLIKRIGTNDSIPKQLNVEQSDFNLPNVTDHLSTCQWYKCRGQTYKNLPITNEKSQIKCDKVSKIEILEAYNLLKCVDASPTLFQYTDGKKYAVGGSHSGFIVTIELDNQMCVSAFKIKLPDRIEASVLVFDNFKGVVGCYDSNVYCLHLKTGEIIWKYQTGDIVKCTAIYCKEQEVIFIGSYDCYVYCLSAKDGGEIWKIKGSNGSISASGCLHSPSGSVLFGTLDGFCLALQQRSGEITWRHKLTDPVFVAPVTLNSGLVLFCSVTGILSCFNIQANVKVWEYKINGNVFSYIVKRNDDTFTDYENIIIASQNKNVYCLQLKNSSFQTEPTLKHTLNFHSPIFATPWCEDNFLLVACTDGTLNIYNFATNRLIKSEKLPGEVFSSPVVDNDIAIIGCRDNNVYVLKFT
ncbi:aminoadipate-semialdehyde dehydrogenase isoform X1 [Osmia lignaria lignaria]|uniref:aminoadipate-semialdehyde dehydrogenase isoform X1 n=1 Tax=Osmia lignaria lignaria TaxID=1437193 RepID=UPI0014790081|nr:beta-alanine-activating enzyme isoform X1 [Osmia lignaria]